MHDGLQLHVLVQQAFELAFGPDRAQVVEHVGLAAVGTATGDFDTAIVGEQRRRLLPL